MLYTIKNEFLTVTVSDLGAELQSVKNKNGEEWIWQGDPAYWQGRAPNLFPFCGRFWNGLATVDGVPCNPGTHGFLRQSLTTLEEAGETRLVFSLCSSPETLSLYPFAFALRMIYELDGCVLSVRAEVTNTGERTMPYGYGGHPGFRVPFAGGEQDEYFVCFDEPCEARAIRFDEKCCYPVGGTKPFALEDGRRFVISDSFFEKEGCVFLCEIPKKITLATARSPRHVTLRYEGFPYLGLWKALGGEYICIEPWCSLPATYGQSTELNEKKELVRAQAGETKSHQYSITFAEE